MITIIKQAVRVGTGVLLVCAAGAAAGASSADATYVLESRTQSFSATKQGFLEQYTNCCPPLVRYFTNEQTWFYITLKRSNYPDCSSPYWDGHFEKYELARMSPPEFQYIVCQGDFSWSSPGISGSGIQTNCNGWLVVNGNQTNFLTDIMCDAGVYFWRDSDCDFDFWSIGTPTVLIPNCHQKFTTNTIPDCTTRWYGIESVEYLAGTNIAISQLTNEFTTLTLINQGLHATLTNDWAPCGNESPHGSVWLSEDEVDGMRTAVEARFKVFCPANRPFAIDYLLCRPGLSNAIPVKTKCKLTGIGTGAWQYLNVDLPIPYSTWTSNGCLFYRGETNWIEAPCAGGSTCAQCSQSPGSTSASLTDSGLFVQAGLGPSTFAQGASSLTLAADSPSPALTTPAALELTGDFTGAEVIRSAGALRQIKNAGATCLADVQAAGATSFVIRFYDQFGGMDNGLYDVSSFQPFSSATIAQGSTTNQLVVTMDTGTSAQYTYDWSETDHAWTMTSGNALRRETRSWDPVLLARTNTIRSASGAVLYEEATYYTNLPNFGLILAKHVLGPSGPALTTQYTYYDNQQADGTNYGSLKMIIQPTGFWQRYEYDSQARITKEISQFLNSDSATNAPEDQCRVVQYDYTPLDGAHSSETRIEKLLGVEISRQYSIEYASSNRTIRCATAGAAWTNSNNLVTLTTSYPDGQFAGRTQSARNSDGTLQLYSYEDNGVERKTTILSGAPNASWTDVTNGTKTVSQSDSSGVVQPTVTYDIVLGDSYPVPGAGTFFYDSLGRLFRTVYPDYTEEYINFNCCGIDSIVDRQGVTSTYLYDALKRQIGTIRNGVTTSNLLDAAGNVLGTFRVGTDGSIITNSRAVFDVAGRLTFETNAFGGWTSYNESKDGSGQTVKTTVYPDGGTRIETFYQDGSLQRVTGTAAFPVRYEYGIENDGEGATSAFTKEIKLDAAYADTAEWTKTYTDMLGRAYKTVYSAPAAPYPVRRSFWNNLGQLAKEVDPDGVATLFQYNNKGELEYNAIDMDTDGHIDFAGTDRITRTVTEFVAKGGQPWRATSTYVWTQDGSDSPLLDSLSMASADGLRSVTFSGGLTNSTQIDNFWDSRWRRIRAYGPDGTLRTETRVECGTNVYAYAWDSWGQMISEVYFASDAFGRQARVAEARADYSFATNITFFNAADQVSATLTPVPAAGQAPQVTTNYFDNVGRIWRTKLPDGTSVTNEYFPTGLLKKTYGSRTYPVEYTYDPQGRTKTMKTWQDFAGNSGTATTTWNYDGHRGWLRGKLYADGRGPLYTNTPAGRLYTRTWARGIRTTYGYNNAGDLSTVSYSDGSPGITYSYDRQGRRTSAAQGGTTQTLAFNDAGLLLSESFSGGPLNDLCVTNEYDEFLRRTNLAVLKSSIAAVQQSFSYDAFSRLQTAAEGDNRATYSYVAYSSRVGEIEFSHQTQLVMSTAKQYDGLNRLTNITALDAWSQVLDSHVYGYNAANQRTNHVLKDNSFWVYTYDGLGQVTSGRKYWPDGNPVAGLQFTYGFDDIGNRKTAASGGDQQGLNLHVQNYTANNLNQYTSRSVPGFAAVVGSANSNATVTVWADNGAAARSIRQGEHFYAALPVNNPTGAVWLTLTNIAVLPNGTNPDIVTNTTGKALLAKTPESFTYDLDGNLTSDSLWTSIWNAENRRTNVESRTTVPTAARAREQWSYLPDGRWIERIVSAWNGSMWVLQYTNRYVWDGQVLMAVLDHTNGVVLSFLRGLDLSGSMQGAGGVGGLLAVSQFSHSQITNSHFACFDGNGNVMALVGAADGILSAEYEYGPFGEPLRATGAPATANPIRFSTQYADDVAGALKYLLRDYNQVFGRWECRDPLEEAVGPNLLTFVGNDAIDFCDLYGLRQTGHHIIPEAVMKHICGPKRGKKIFDKYFDIRAGAIPVPTGDHGYGAAHIEYSRRVEQLLRDYMANNEVACACLKSEHATRMISLIDKCQDPYIRGYLASVGGGSAAVKEWFLKKGAATAAEDAALVARAGGGVLRTARLGGKVVKVLVIGEFVYLATENGLQAAAEQTIRDLVFADEILAGGEWLVNKTREKFDPLTKESCCERNGLDPEEMLDWK